MTNEELYAEINDLLRTMPPRATIRHETPENLSWLGRAAAVLRQWNYVRFAGFDLARTQMHMDNAQMSSQGVNQIVVLLHEAQHDLRLKTTGPASIPIAQGDTFVYFDELRKIIETAQQDLLFVDPYIDAEFVSRYLPHVKQGVRARLLGRKNMPALVSAVERFVSQNQSIVEVRHAADFHDRYVFVDKSSCFHSGATFKDGGVRTPTVIHQVTDAFPAMLQTYEDMWARATVQSWAQAGLLPKP